MRSLISRSSLFRSPSPQQEEVFPRSKHILHSPSISSALGFRRPVSVSDRPFLRRECMAFAFPTQRRIVVTAPHHLVDSNGAPVLHPNPAVPPLPSPPSTVSYYPVPVGYVLNPFYGVPFLGHSRPPAIPVPLRLRCDPAFLARIDEQRNRSLVQFMRREGRLPSREEAEKRRRLIEQLKEIVLAWIRRVALQRGLPKDEIASTSATVLPFGSYGLGVYTCGSDIDALCIGPYFATFEEDFFIVLHSMLQSRSEVSEMHCIKRAKVPLMCFKFNGISVDLPYAQILDVSVSDNVNTIDRSLPLADQKSWRSLSGVRANACICQLVPNVGSFQSMLRCIRLWARRRGIYSHLFGFLGGIHFAILAAYICQKSQKVSINVLLSVFFKTFACWSWPEPVILQDSSMPYYYPEERPLMPIMMPYFPFEWCNSNITTSTFYKIKTEFQRAYMMIKDAQRPDFDWTHLFEFYPYTKKHTHFVRIFFAAPDGDKLRKWVGWVKSRFRGLLLKLETMQGYCDPIPTEYVDHSVAEANVVFYWGLSSNAIESIGIDSIKEDFMKSVNRSHDSEGCSHSGCTLELSIVEASQLPKSA